MLDYTKVSKIYLVCGKTDLRKGIDGLAAIIQHQYQFDPYENALFLFCGGRLDRFKCCTMKTTAICSFINDWTKENFIGPEPKKKFVNSVTNNFAGCLKGSVSINRKPFVLVKREFFKGFKRKTFLLIIDLSLFSPAFPFDFW